MDKSSRLGKITRAKTREDVAVAATVVAQTFAARPVGEWLVPDPDRRFSLLAAVFDIKFAHAMETGVIDLLIEVDQVSCLGAGVGVAVWLDHTVPIAPHPISKTGCWTLLVLGTPSSECLTCYWRTIIRPDRITAWQLWLSRPVVRSGGSIRSCWSTATPILISRAFLPMCMRGTTMRCSFSARTATPRQVLPSRSVPVRR